MKLLITGASGFIGRHVVNEAARRGHQITAIVRKLDNELVNTSTTSLCYVEHDLTNNTPIQLPGKQIDCAIHLAAAMTGDEEAQYKNTIIATKNFLENLKFLNVNKLVAISSIAFYAYNDLKNGAVVTEATPIEKDLSSCNLYARMKFQQENLCKKYQAGDNTNVLILRPGIVYDDKNLNDFPVGIIKKGHCVQVVHAGDIPVVHVKNLAEAIVNAVEVQALTGTILNIVDDDLPAQEEYLNALVNSGSLTDTCHRINWKYLYVFINLVNSMLNIIRLSGILRKLPDTLKVKAFSARFKPFRYSNSRAKDILNWAPQIKFNELFCGSNKKTG